MNSDRSTPATGYLDADRPIERGDEDRLDRRSLAGAITKQILTLHLKQGFTLAVLGEWGSGKTSILNMVSETLLDDGDGAAVLRFNPWLFSSAADLIPRFFGELSAQLNQRDLKGLKDVARALSEVGESLAPLSPIPGTAIVTELLAKLTWRATQPPSLLEKRERLRDALTRSDSRVVVLIDDIDRLEPSETRELMRLVRLTSDLPNIVFLLAFDRRRVARSLSRAEDEEEGQQYLDKILQITYDLPTVHEAILPDRFFTWLEELLQGREVGQLDKPVWGRVFYEVIKPLLGNLRHVKRYLSSLPVPLDMIGPEVALPDLLGLEALRVVRPRLFEELKAHAEYLVHPTSPSRLLMARGAGETEIKDQLSGILERAAGDRTVMESVLEILFPATQQFVGRRSYGTDRSADWRRQRRVACEEVLRIYLNAGLDDGALALSEVQDLVGALTDQNQFAQLVDALDDQRFERALERLEDYQHEFPVEAVGIAVPVLVNRMGRLSAHSAGFLHVSPRMKASRVILRLLRRIQDLNALAESVHEILGKIDTLSGWQCVVEMVGHRESFGAQLVGEDQAKTLEDRLLERLESATAEQLAEEWNLFALLVRPLSWLDEEDRGRLTARLREHLTDDGFVLALLRLAVVDVSTNGHVSKQFGWDSLIDAVGEGLAEAVGRLAESQLYENGSTEDRQVVELAQKYVSGWRPEPWGGL